ncbi:hypothetical protein FRZ67_18430 [Panacibacter ginsenosidivorans]|uniref:DUF4136 domain-containing protein n=1 Tax=Panacibacter ginsenosidivorans TaxID=1813871 RepID=A0A5B8VDX4_9BACT|nr:hypothetical protein [Panacibacter ginsenosidivorans]QEC69191.1 hypothetical protein FRZ67_18430 [Panacibacter ginsenosidivorans]
MKKSFVSLLLITLIVISCTNTRITSSWKAPASTPVKYKKILVIALSQPDNSLKEKMEQHLVGDLKSHAIDAISAYQQYGPKEFDKMNEEGFVEQIKNTGTDAIMTIVLLDKSKERNYVPNHIIYTPYAIYYDRFWGYYTTIYGRVYTPGYYVTNTEYFWESNLYDATTKHLVYSVQTKSFNPDNSESLAHEYGQLIVSDMVKKEVIGKE